MRHPVIIFTISILCILTLYIGGCANNTDLSSKNNVNIVWIISDDQSFTDFGFMGNDVVKTPALDELASQSAVFPNGYNPTSLCRASLATIITGKYAFDHGICFNDPEGGVDRTLTEALLKFERPLPSLLSDAGYKSLQTGKFWEGHYKNGGFTSGMTLGGRHGDKGLAIGRKGLLPIENFIQSSKSDPFFIWYAPFLPHTPHNASDKYTSQFTNLGLAPETVKYYANILWFDETVGQLIDVLKRDGVYENTLIMFASDNGWISATSEEEKYIDPVTGRKWANTFKDKRSPYDMGVRTPFIIHWPEKIKPAVYNDLVSTIDLVPTALAAAGISVNPNAFPGMDLLPKVKNGTKISRSSVFGEIYTHTARKWDHPDTNVLFRWVRSGDYKLIVPQGVDLPLELYNVTIDPFEESNLADNPEYKDITFKLTGEVNEWWEPKPLR